MLGEASVIGSGGYCWFSGTSISLPWRFGEPLDSECAIDHRNDYTAVAGLNTSSGRRYTLLKRSSGKARDHKANSIGRKYTAASEHHF
jgi:hypothetical protein